jgi:hypothetical protein
MKIPKKKALELIDDKISLFRKILENSTYDNRYKEDYDFAYCSTENLLGELFSKEEVISFRTNTSQIFSFIEENRVHAKELQNYKDHINSCIAQLKVYREKIENFWEENELETITKSRIVPFVSMSFNESDQDINQYVTGILDALQIKFETGERYSKDSIPEKVQSRIRSSDIFIIIFVNRDKIEGGGFTTPSWLHKELGIAQGAKKDIIAWVEKGIKDIAGLNYEKEVIYFERNNVKEIEKATIKFLEALKEHNLI